MQPAASFIAPPPTSKHPPHHTIFLQRQDPPPHKRSPNDTLILITSKWKDAHPTFSAIRYDVLEMFQGFFGVRLCGFAEVGEFRGVDACEADGECLAF